MQPLYRQRFGTDTQYRSMAHPFRKQKLMLLYPGRYTSPQYDFTGSNIPNEDPVGAERTIRRSFDLAVANAIETESMYRSLGGKDKIVRHPAVEPDSIIEDPALSLAGLLYDENMQGTDFVEKSNLDNLQNVRKLTNNINREYGGDSVRSQNSENSQNSPNSSPQTPITTLPPEGFKFTGNEKLPELVYGTKGWKHTMTNYAILYTVIILLVILFVLSINR